MTEIVGGNFDDPSLLQANKTKDFTLIMPIMYVENSKISKEQEANFGEPQQECYSYHSLSRPHRKVFFLLCNLIGIICYIIAMTLVDRGNRITVPSYMSASSLFILSMIFLWGPTDCVKRLCTLQGALFTIIYGSAIVSVLYLSEWYWNGPYLLAIMVGQIAILLWFIVSNIPGGKAFVIFLWTWMCEKVDKLLPII